MKARLVKFQIVAVIAIFNDEGICIGEKRSNEISYYPVEPIDLVKVGQEMEQIIENQYEFEKTNSR